MESKIKNHQVPIALDIRETLISQERVAKAVWHATDERIAETIPLEGDCGDIYFDFFLTRM